MPLVFITGALVARAVGPEGKGILFLLGGVSGVLGSLFSFGLNAAAVYHYKQNSLSLGEILAVCFFLSGLSMAVASLMFVIGANVFISVFMGTAETMTFQPVWIWLTLATFLLGLMSGPVTGLLIADGDMKLYALMSIYGSFLGIGLTWLFALLLAWGITGVLLSQLLTALLPIIILLNWMIRKGTVARLELTRRAIREMLRIGLQHYGLSLVAIVTKRFDAFLISGLLTVRDAGYFSIASGVFNIFLSVPRAGTYPLIAKMASKDDDRLSRSNSLSRIQFTLMLALVVVFAPFVLFFIRIVYGEAFLPAAGAVWLILPAIAGANLCVTTSAYLNGLGQAGRGIPPAIFGSVFQVITALILLPRIGVEGSSIALGVSYLITVVLLFFVTGRRELRLAEMSIVTEGDLRFVLSYLAGVWRGFRPVSPW